MSFVRVESIEASVTPTEKAEIVTFPSWTWAEIEDVLSAEWEIGGSPRRPTRFVDLLKRNKNTSEGI